MEDTTANSINEYNEKECMITNKSIEKINFSLLDDDNLNINTENQNINN